ncbi:MAG: FAD-dependent oxidoreductase [Eubacteriales bacterium]|nr:FAD-dependent oxidoreductase [Eubacteriales bacterium]
MSEIKLTINGIGVTANQGDTVLDVAKANGIEIPTLCHHESVKVYGACSLCLIEAEGVPKLLRACSTKAADGMVINTESERVVKARKVALELLMSDHVGDCVAPCSLNCPAGTDCQAYIKAIAQGDDKKAVEIIKERLPLPASIGRVCPHPCESNCRRALVEEPMSIAFMKYFAADNDLNSATPFMPEKAAATGKSVAILGGGPAGLTAAYFLASMGHKVTIFDKMPKMGGMLRYGIPEYRLPKAVLDKEIALIEALGVEMKNNVKIGEDISFPEIRKQFDATLVAIGAWSSMSTRTKGEELEGVVGGIDFLQKVALGKDTGMGKNVAVVGGGNTAMDACRTAVRLGAENVYVIYRRTRAEMPAEDIEIAEAMEEGVEFKFLTNPDEYLGENGKVTQVKLQVMELGEPDASGRRAPVAVEGKFETLDVDTVIAAIGQKVNPTGFEEIELNSRGIISADEFTFRTNLPDVFAVGDATNRGASIAIAAIGEAERASKVIDSFLKGDIVPYIKPFVSEKTVTAEDLAHKEKLPRAKMPHRSPEERKHDFKEINFGFSEETARSEAKRCLECGCHDYKDCSLIRHANRYEIHPERFEGVPHKGFLETRLVAIERNQDKCILCNLCVRTCDEVAHKGILGLVGRGFDTVIKPEFNDPETIADCKNCRKCFEVCPTGALKLL